MKSIEEMLDTWQRSASVMHISHHVAAGRYAKYQRWFGAFVSGLSALVASSIFIAALEGDNKDIYLIAAFISLITAILTGVNSSLNLSERSQDHHNAATKFQGLRREIEEDLVNCKNGSVKQTYEHLRNRWTQALEDAPPLPPSVHDRVKKEINTRHKEQE